MVSDAPPRAQSEDDGTVKDALRIAASACAACLDRIYEPVVACVERVLSNESATTSAAASATGKAPEWKSLTGNQVGALMWWPAHHCHQADRARLLRLLKPPPLLCKRPCVLTFPLLGSAVKTHCQEHI